MAGHQKITADGVLGVSGKPVRVFGYVIASANTGPGIVTLYDGTDATGTEFDQQQGVADDNRIVSYGPEGKFFPSGCYVDVDANVSYVDFDYIQVQS